MIESIIIITEQRIGTVKGKTSRPAYRYYVLQLLVGRCESRMLDRTKIASTFEKMVPGNRSTFSEKEWIFYYYGTWY